MNHNIIQLINKEINNIYFTEHKNKFKYSLKKINDIQIIYYDSNYSQNPYYNRQSSITYIKKVENGCCNKTNYFNYEGRKFIKCICPGHISNKYCSLCESNYEYCHTCNNYKNNNDTEIVHNNNLYGKIIYDV